MLILRLLFYIAALFKLAKNFPPTAAYFEPFYYQSKSFTYMDLVLAGVYLWVMIYLFPLLRQIRKNQLFQLPAILFMLWGIVPLYVGWFNGNPNIFSYMRIFAWVIAIILMPLAFSTFDRIYSYLKFNLLLHAGRVIYYLIFETYLPNDWFHKFDTIDRFDIFAMAVIIAAIAQFKRKTLFERFLIWIILPASAAVSMVDHTRAIYLAFILTVALYSVVWLLKRKERLLKLSYLAILPLTLLMLLGDKIYDATIESFTSISNYQYDASISYRITAINSSINKIRESPFFGYGLGTDLSAEDYNPRLRQSVTRTLHNFYLEMLLWGGGLTLLFYLLLHFKIIKAGLMTGISSYSPAATLLLTESIILIADLFTRFASPSTGTSAFTYWFHPALVLALINIVRVEQTQRQLS